MFVSRPAILRRQFAVRMSGNVLGYIFAAIQLTSSTSVRFREPDTS
jgi:hypothetical protein